MKKYVPILVVAALLAATLACNPLTPSVEQILSDSADAMTEVETLSFEIDLSDVPLVIDPSTDMTVEALDGQYEAPDDVFVTARISVGGAITEAEFVWQGDDLWGRIPGFAPDWDQIDSGMDWQPSDLFDDRHGLPALLRDKVAEAELDGEEDVEGVTAYHIVGQVYESDLADVFGPEFDDGDGEDTYWDVEIWIDKATKQVVKVSLTGEDGTWEGLFFDYGEDVDIPNP